MKLNLQAIQKFLYFNAKSAALGTCQAITAMLHPRPNKQLFKGVTRKVSSASHGNSVVSLRYANALIELAEGGKMLDKVEKDLNDLRGMIDSSSELASLIRSPVTNKASTLKAVQALAEKAKFQDITKNFLGVLVENRRLGALEAIIKAANALFSERRGEITVDVAVAQDLSAAQKKELQDALSKAMKTDVAVNVTVKPDILGGMVVTIGSHMIDDSVARKLARLKAAMGAQANENVNLKEVS